MAKATKPQSDQETVDAAVQAVVKARRSFRDVAKEHGVSHVQVRRWVMAWRLKHPSAPPPAEPEASPWAGLTASLAEQNRPEYVEPEPPRELSADPIQVMKEMLRENMARVDQLRKLGNHEVAQRAARDCAKSAEAIARLEAARPHDEGDLVVKRDEIADIKASLAVRIAALPVGHELRCVDCGRALRMKWGIGGGEGGSQPGTP